MSTAAHFYGIHRHRKDSFHFTMQEQKKPLLQRGGIVCLCALICTGLWGSAFPCIKIGYRILEISSSDTASQLLFAGLRFTIAGILTILFGSILQKKILLPHVHSLSKIAGISLFQTILQFHFRRNWRAVFHPSGMPGFSAGIHDAAQASGVPHRLCRNLSGEHFRKRKYASL